MIVQKIIKFAKNNRFLGPYYEKIRVYRRDRPLYGKCEFEDRSKGNRRLCIVLAGYKDYLYPAVLGRVAKYAPDDLDVCICSSGLFSEELSRICKDRNWSYLSTKLNNISLIQNIAIRLHPQAEFIYKLDEDIFITKDFFNRLYKAYMHAGQSQYFPGVVAPLIPINGYGHMRILEKLGLLSKYENMFETPKYAAGSERKIECSPEAARFFWGEGGKIPSIDEMNERFFAETQEERPCPIRFSIGAILFKRELWEKMGYFPVDSGIGLGSDETRICAYCCTASRPLMVSENMVVGHFSFGKQNNDMKEYFLSHKDIFEKQ